MLVHLATVDDRVRRLGHLPEDLTAGDAAAPESLIKIAIAFLSDISGFKGQRAEVISIVSIVESRRTIKSLI